MRRDIRGICSAWTFLEVHLFSRGGPTQLFLQYTEEMTQSVLSNRNYSEGQISNDILES